MPYVKIKQIKEMKRKSQLMILELNSIQNYRQRDYLIQFNVIELIIQIMYYQPTKKQPKNTTSAEQANRNRSADKTNFIQRNKQLQTSKKLTEKNVNSLPIPKVPSKITQKTIPQKVEHLEKVIQKLSKGTGNPDMQKMLLEQIKGIKNELRQIKQQIGLNPNSSPGLKSVVNCRQQQQEQIEENIADMVPRQEPEIAQHHAKDPRVQSKTVIEQNLKKSTTVKNLQHYSSQKHKQLIDIGKIQPYMKQFKLEASKMLQPIYRGYHKKSSKPVVIKYCGENESMDGTIALYQKLWKNIVKAKQICINKIYDLNEALATNIMALQMNKFSIQQMQAPPLQILKHVLRGIQFFHQCGYLYRNVHPDHVMMSFQGNIVLLDLKLMKRYTDIKGKVIEVRGNVQTEGVSEFISNARLRGMAEGRKDDLQCLGYLGLYLLQGKLPWNISNIVQVRSKLTLQNLYGNYSGLLQFMIIVHKMSSQQTPNYDALYNLINQ